MDKSNSSGQNLQQFLADYNPNLYPHPSYTCDILIFRERETAQEILLIKRGNHPYIGDWAIPGGFVNQGESGEQCAARELCEETGIINADLKQLYTVSTPARDPRGWTISTLYTATVPPQTMAVAGDDAAEAKWFTVNIKGNANGATTLTLTSGKLVISAEVQVVKNSSGKIDVNKSRLITTQGIAFDHAKLILYAID